MRRTDIEVMRVAIDYCPEVCGRFTGNMDGLRKLDNLLDAVEQDELSARLRRLLAPNAPPPSQGIVDVC